MGVMDPHAGGARRMRMVSVSVGFSLEVQSNTLTHRAEHTGERDRARPRRRLSTRLIPIAQNGRNLIGGLAFAKARRYGHAKLLEERQLLVAGGLSAPGRFGI